jgi:hypothetical protein
MRVSFLVLLFSLCVTVPAPASQEDVFIKVMMLQKKIGINHAKALSQWITESTRQHNLNVNTVLAIAYAESRFDQSMRGTQGDTGIMQVMPFWRKETLCSKLRLWHAADNIECGCRILKFYIDEFGGNEIAGITSYNQGPYNTRWFLKTKVDLRRHVGYTKTILEVKALLDSFDAMREKLSPPTLINNNTMLLTLDSHLSSFQPLEVHECQLSQQSYLRTIVLTNVCLSW